MFFLWVCNIMQSLWKLNKKLYVDLESALSGKGTTLPIYTILWTACALICPQMTKCILEFLQNIKSLNQGFATIWLPQATLAVPTGILLRATATLIMSWIATETVSNLQCIAGIHLVVFLHTAELIVMSHWVPEVLTLEKIMLCDSCGV
jgi:hypothetical protein